MPIIVEKNRAEVLTFYPPRQFLVKPTAADIRVGTPSVSLPAEGSETSITANIDATSTTLSASASRDDDEITVASATGIVAGRKYLLTSEGRKQVVTVRAIVSTTIHLEDPLREDVANGSTFVGLAVTHTLTTGQTATTGTGEVILRLTLSGIQRRIDEILRVEDRIFPLTLTAESLMRRHEVRRLRDASDLTLGECITEAWEGILRPKLRARKIVEDRIRTPSEIEPAHKEACLLLLYRAAGRSQEDIDAQDKRLYHAITDLLESRDLWYETSSASGALGRGDVDYGLTAWITR